jgi:hypothetical protein
MRISFSITIFGYQIITIEFYAASYNEDEELEVEHISFEPISEASDSE